MVPKKSRRAQAELLIVNFLATSLILSGVAHCASPSAVNPDESAEQVNPESRRLDGSLLGKIFSTLLRGVGRYSQFPFGCNCDRHFEPVCGTDGMTYPNRCYVFCKRSTMMGGLKAGLKRSTSQSSMTSSDGAAGIEERTMKFFQELGPGGNLECTLLPDGSDYAGHIEFTRTGRRCARWDTHRDTYPITPDHPFTPIQDYNFPEQSISAARNFCRNPDRDRRGPWCFTGSPHEPYNFDFCEVPHCGDPHDIYMNGLGGAGPHPGMFDHPVRPGGGGFGMHPGYPNQGGIGIAHEGPCKPYVGYPPFDQAYRRLEEEGTTSLHENKDRELACSNSEEYSTSCDEWAREGKCLKSYTFMKAHCPKSCFPSLCGSSIKSPDESGAGEGGVVRYPK